MTAFEVELASRLTTMLGVGVESSGSNVAGAISLRLAGLDSPHGFSVTVSSGVAAVHARLVFDPLARQVIEDLETGTSNQERVIDLLSSFAQIGQKLVLVVDGKSVFSPVDFPPSPWGILDLSGSSAYGEDGYSESILTIVAGIFGVIIELAGWSVSTGSVSDEADFAMEGAYSRHQVGKYERSPANRAIAIRVHGTRCYACGLDFEEVYGELGAGFVEIHHVLPVSMMGGSRVVDPRTDLVPLCSNCHSMIHRKVPPLSPQELRETFLRRASLIHDAP